jgi:hypothetical protein
MKRILIFGAIAAIFLSGCEVHPYADFAVRNRLVQPGDIIYFENLSDHAVSYDWDFGDGYFTTNFSPSHVYDNEGTYTVTLTAVSKDGNVDKASITIEVYYTELEITVAEWNEFGVIDYIVPNARVRLYQTLEDWDNETYLYAEGYTDNLGIITFIGLLPQRYYVDVQSSTYSNYALGLEDVGFIETGALEPGRLVLFTAWADYYPPGMLENGRLNIDRTKINNPRTPLLIPDVSK